MTRTTRPPALDLAARFPAIAAYARTTVRLHPRRGNPTAQDSHLGGPLLWPAGEPWPSCGRPKAFHPNPQQPEATVGVGQFYARDLPELPFPPGTDLLQVLWCPHTHEDLQGSIGPYVQLFWRDSDSITPTTEPPPEPGMLDGDDSRLPLPCVLNPERVREYPWYEELPAELVQALDGLEAEFGVAAGNDQYSYQYSLSIASGSKVGGWVAWSVTDQIPQPCPECASPMDHLLTIDDYEWDGGSLPRWRPIEEDLVDHLADRPTGMDLHDAVRIFVCPVSLDHPVRVDCQ
ncbi:YwqG family protein [Crossiella cryophila]|uniref:DUF1963 domain-containing protein n=1 Tax=Crossiella cryophila TaxID=43355 RepID=A0A7W7FVV7_9PSEU|nr:DUF1963 domain-containing protein [Crossiella cryophila]MBB4678923.1 hypothetical protein [Crossiella cryophila]